MLPMPTTFGAMPTGRGLIIATHVPTWATPTSSRQTLTTPTCILSSSRGQFKIVAPCVLQCTLFDRVCCALLLPSRLLLAAFPPQKENSDLHLSKSRPSCYVARHEQSTLLTAPPSTCTSPTPMRICFEHLGRPPYLEPLILSDSTMIDHGRLHLPQEESQRLTHDLPCRLHASKGGSGSFETPPPEHNVFVPPHMIGATSGSPTNAGIVRRPGGSAPLRNTCGGLRRSEDPVPHERLLARSGISAPSTWPKRSSMPHGSAPWAASPSQQCVVKTCMCGASRSIVLLSAERRVEVEKVCGTQVVAQEQETSTGR